MSGAASVAAVTVAHLLGVPELRGAEVAGGSSGLSGVVSDVVVVSSLRQAETLAAGTLAVAAFRNPLGYELDVLARTGHSRQVAALLTTGPRRVLGPTTRMCDRLGLPLLVVPDADPVGVAARLARHVHDPMHLAVSRLVRITRLLPAMPATIEQVLAPVADGLAAPVALLDHDGEVLAGDDIRLPDTVLPTYVTTLDVEGGHVVLAPVTVEDPLRPEAWLATLLPRSPVPWRDGAEQLLRIVAFAVSSTRVRERVAAERDARDRSTLAAELMDTTRAPNRHTVERALRVGWRLDGWHIGIYLRLSGDARPGPATSPTVERALRERGLVGAFAERADGWVAWTTAETELPSDRYREVRAAVTAALEDVDDELGVVAGVGRPYEGRGGIGRTLQEAGEASLFAGVEGARVEHVDGLGSRRLLARWHQSEAFVSYATGLIGPLRDHEVLLDTLQVYLDRESSATATASALDVHRNTVNQRVARAEQLLGLDLTRADDRLVVQLACRVARGRSGG